MKGSEIELILQPIFGYSRGWQRDAAKALYITYPHFNKLINDKANINSRMEKQIIDLSNRKGNQWNE